MVSRPQSRQASAPATTRRGIASQIMRPWIKFILERLEFTPKGLVAGLRNVEIACELWPNAPVRSDLADVLAMSKVSQ